MRRIVLPTTNALNSGMKIREFVAQSEIMIVGTFRKFHQEWNNLHEMPAFENMSFCIRLFCLYVALH